MQLDVPAGVCRWWVRCGVGGRKVLAQSPCHQRAGLVGCFEVVGDVKPVLAGVDARECGIGPRGGDGCVGLGVGIETGTVYCRERVDVFGQGRLGELGGGQVSAVSVQSGYPLGAGGGVHLLAHGFHGRALRAIVAEYCG